MRVRAFIGLGSNLDDPEQQVRGACRDLQLLPKSALVSCSSLYRSRPLGPKDQPDFINAVAELRTELEPEALLGELQRIERGHGRVRGGEPWGPRPLDLDLLLLGDRVIRSARLTVPHPRMTEREFVLYPLIEIAGPELDIPDHGPLGALASACDPRGLEKLDRCGREMD